MVDWDALTARAVSGIEGLESESLGLGCFNDLVDIDAHFLSELFELVHQRDIDAAVDVIKEFAHLCGGWAVDGDDATEDGTEAASSRATFPQPLMTSGILWRATVSVRGPHAPGRRRDEYGSFDLVSCDCETKRIACFRDRGDHLSSSSRIGGAFNNNQVVFADVGASVAHIAEVGLMVLVEGLGTQKIIASMDEMSE